MAKAKKSTGKRKSKLADRTSFNFGANVRRRGNRRGGKGGGS
jgi:hypothetical protein